MISYLKQGVSLFLLLMMQSKVTKELEVAAICSRRRFWLLKNKKRIPR